MKILNGVVHWFFVFCLSLALWDCNPTGTKFKRNENLWLLLADEDRNLFNPVWAPNGIHIYYLNARSLSGALNYAEGGELWCIDVDGTNGRQVLAGDFCALAISPDGQRIALSYEVGNSELKFEGGPLIIADTSGFGVDTVVTAMPKILDVEFSNDGSRLYYYAYSADTTKTDSFGFYSIDTAGNGEEYIENCDDWEYFAIAGFDLDNTNSIYHSIAGEQFRSRPQFNPQDSNILLYVSGGDPQGPSELETHNFQLNTDIILDADPYHSVDDYSGILSAYWSPNGEMIVLSVGDIHGEVFFVGTLELWILEDVGD